MKLWLNFFNIQILHTPASYLLKNCINRVCKFIHKSENSDLTFPKLKHIKGMVSSNLVNVIFYSFKRIQFKIQDFATNYAPTYTRMSAINGGRTKFLGEVDSEMKAGQVKWQSWNNSTFWQQDILFPKPKLPSVYPTISKYYFVSNLVVKMSRHIRTANTIQLCIFRTSTLFLLIIVHTALVNLNAQFYEKNETC